jgi:hypothetical protein
MVLLMGAESLAALLLVPGLNHPVVSTTWIAAVCFGARHYFDLRALQTCYT